MSNQLSIKADPPLQDAGPQTVTKLPAAAPTAPAAKPVPLFVNPSYKFDPTVGLVVIEFHDNSGTISNSIPSQRQLQAYRDHQETPPGEMEPEPPKAQPLVSGKTAAG